MWNTSPLALSIFKNCFGVTDYFLSLKGINTEIIDDCGRTIAIQFCANFNVDTLENLKYLSKRCDIDFLKLDGKGETALHALCSCSFDEDQIWEIVVQDYAATLQAQNRSKTSNGKDKNKYYKLLSEMCKKNGLDLQKEINRANEDYESDGEDNKYDEGHEENEESKSEANEVNGIKMSQIAAYIYKVLID